MQSENTVIDITRRVSPFPQQSKLYFPVRQKKLYYHDGGMQESKTHKLLVRVPSEDASPVVPLAVVGMNYKTIPNAELFPYVEARMVERLGPQVLRDVRVEEQMSYQGRDCYRTYTFPSVRCDVPGGGDVAFRLIIGNSYGAKAVQLIAGAIDFFCTNGMIIGVHEKTARRHTSGLTLNGLDEWIGNSVTYFTKHQQVMKAMTEKLVPVGMEDALFVHLVDKALMAERHANEMNNGMHYERNRRSGRDVRPSLWHLYCALTAWATHGDVRDTGNDHAANTRIDRGRHVNRVMAEANAFLKMAA